MRTRFLIENDDWEARIEGQPFRKSLLAGLNPQTIRNRLRQDRYLFVLIDKRTGEIKSRHWGKKKKLEAFAHRWFDRACRREFNMKQKDIDDRFWKIGKSHPWPRRRRRRRPREI